jgi:6-pyruvoyltetrahydropterin/6-carboxytetrahydropterin synthase
MFKVTKIIRFCYGHRLLNYKGKCSRLHGHNARAEIELSSLKLDRRGMVADFGDVKKKLQGWIDDTLDHRLLLNRADPVLALLQASQEPVVALEENPTAEAIARLIYQQAKEEGFPVEEVRLWETETSFATYRDS